MRGELNDTFMAHYLQIMMTMLTMLTMFMMMERMQTDKPPTLLWMIPGANIHHIFLPHAQIAPLLQPTPQALSKLFC